MVEFLGKSFLGDVFVNVELELLDFIFEGEVMGLGGMMFFFGLGSFQIFPEVVLLHVLPQSGGAPFPIPAAAFHSQN